MMWVQKITGCPEAENFRNVSHRTLYTDQETDQQFHHTHRAGDSKSQQFALYLVGLAVPGWAAASTEQRLGWQWEGDWVRWAQVQGQSQPENVCTTEVSARCAQGCWVGRGVGKEKYPRATGWLRWVTQLEKEDWAREIAGGSSYPRKSFKRNLNVLLYWVETTLENPCINCSQTVMYILSHSVMSNSLQSHGLSPVTLLCPWNFPGKNTGARCHFWLQGIFLTQGSKLMSLGPAALVGWFFTTLPPGKPHFDV